MREVYQHPAYNCLRRTALPAHKSRFCILMRYSAILLSVTAVLFGVIAATAAEPQPARAKSAVPPIPSMSEIKLAVLRHFQAKPDYRSGDLIAREEVDPLLAKLRQMGLPLPDAKEILARVPAKGEFLAKQLSTPNGRKFMRQINVYENGYDRVDRLSRIPLGEQTVRDLVRGPGGYKMIEYMTTTPGGKHFAEEFASVPNGKNFNSPTGRIYTAEQLLVQLEESRDAALKAKKH
jgi:hypothetical protein